MAKQCAGISMNWTYHAGNDSAEPSKLGCPLTSPIAPGGLFLSRKHRQPHYCRVAAIKPFHNPVGIASNRSEVAFMG